MTRLERTERAILIFLIAAFILGIAASAIRKSHHRVKVSVGSFDAKRYKDSDADLASSDGKIDINTASAEDLMKIKGIGRTIAERIVEYRYKSGAFYSIDDIKNVRGVGVALFEKIKRKITVE